MSMESLTRGEVDRWRVVAMIYEPYAISSAFLPSGGCTTTSCLQSSSYGMRYVPRSFARHVVCVQDGPVGPRPEAPAVHPDVVPRLQEHPEVAVEGRHPADALLGPDERVAVAAFSTTGSGRKGAKYRSRRWRRSRVRRRRGGWRRSCAGCSASRQRRRQRRASGRGWRSMLAPSM